MIMNTLSEGAMKALNAGTKLGLIATVDPAGLPHITLMTSLEAKDPNHLMFGQFSSGKSKEHLRSNPLMAFVAVTLDKQTLSGHGRYTHSVREGADYEHYNMQPMFRYNTYFGINTVHYLDLLDAADVAPLPMSRIVPAAIITRLVKGVLADGSRPQPLTQMARDLFNRLDSLKFMAYVDDSGMPQMFPVIQCQAADAGRLAFSTIAGGPQLRSVPVGATVAVFAMNMMMESILVRGTFNGLSRRAVFQSGTVDIDWVYNSMPPCHGQIWPEVPLEPVESF